MYNAFFGFKEKPFKLVPNPDYLFMSKSHEIAMAHLVYATDQGDGFVVITGEVGTGKTTLCRNYLELLNDHTESAYIFNPNLDPAELLASICNEFGITHTGGTVKELLDILNQFLISQNVASRKTILLIDEAQNLTVENLEMVRMLSNLETTRSKLLQIILVGQPELNHKLDSHELRQLAQRISLNYFLTPLSARETEGYIRHRIHIAGQHQSTIFSTRACRLVHRYAKGIPRLINIACDRALLTAYSLNLSKVTAAVVKTAIKELSSHRLSNRQGFRMHRLLWGGLTAILLGVAAAALLQSGVLHKGAPHVPLSITEGPDQTYKMPSTGLASDATESPQPALPAKALEQTVRSPAPELDPPNSTVPSEPSIAIPAPEFRNQADSAVKERLNELNPEDSRVHAVEALLALWKQPNPNVGHIPPVVDDPAFFEIAARQYGLRLYTVEDNWFLVRQLNMPVIVTVTLENTGQSAYLTLVQWSGEQVYLQDQLTGEIWDSDFQSMLPYLQGTAHVFWKNTLGFDAIISQGANNQAVLAVKNLLRKIGYEQIAPAPVFDPATTAAVIDFQKKHQLDADGLVGPLTKILLINAAKAFEVPRLDRGTGA